ncbi:MAG: nucleoside hydrolase [Candidatus Thorarchaeota archaeon]
MPEPVKVIFDTDMDCDCDDAGALAVLHALMDFNEVKILGVIVDVPVEASAKCVKIINNYYNHPEIPVGLIEDPNYEKSKKYQLYRAVKKQLIKSRDYYAEAITEQFFSDISSNQKIREAVNLYRSLLSNSEDHSVIIVAVGLLTALKALLDSPPDDLSPLSGIDLVKLKVKKLVTMGIGGFPSAQAQFNWLMDWESARFVINHWPTYLVVQSNGTEFLTGNKLSIRTPESNPIRKIYETYLRGPRKGNFSWDLITAFYGVKGSEPYLEEKKGYRIILEPDQGKNHWVPDENNEFNHSFLVIKSPTIKLKKTLEDLMTKTPKKK